MPASFLIATDEAGYGPKLGPLVIASTLWEIPSAEAQRDFACFNALKIATKVQGKTISIADSKKLFKPGVSGSLDALRYVTWSSLRACGLDSNHLRDCLSDIAKDDKVAIAEAPWLRRFDDLWCADVDQAVGTAIAETWARAEAKLVGLQVRIITAKEFNAACDRGRNKADLLSSATLGLVAQLMETVKLRCGDTLRHVEVFCDRHGGRRFYGGVLQHTFPSSMLGIEMESARNSIYCLTQNNEQMRIQFTVKGDSFVPVALSSMIAKFLRERAMTALNEYFAERAGESMRLLPTAGYPVDADRFLADIAPIIGREKIDLTDLVRSR